MSYNYAAMAATATRLLTNYGQAMAIRRTTGDTYDPIAGSSSGGTTADTANVGAFVSLKTVFAAGFDIAIGDKVAVVDSTIAPLVSDKLVVGLVAYSIVALQEVNPAGTPLVYRVQVRL